MRERFRTHYGWMAAAAGAVGVALILVAELADVDSLRIFGALLITAGGVGTGIWLGLMDPRRWPMQAIISNWRTWLGIGAVVVLSAPGVLALVAGLAGIASDEGRTASDVLVAAGGVIALVLAVAVLVAVVLGIKVIWRAGSTTAGAPDPTDGPAA